MNQTFTVNLIWGLIPFFGIIIGGAFWLNNRRNRIANASIHSLDLAKKVQTISADELPMSESHADRYRPIVINETEGDDDAEPPYIGWFY
jgi:cbb3-type cytochrome oxidase subunit 3